MPDSGDSSDDEEERNPYAKWADEVGRCPQSARHESFTAEFRSMTEDDVPPNPDGSPPPEAAAKAVLKAELVELMRNAHAGAVHEGVFKILRDGAETLGELKHPQTASEPGDPWTRGITHRWGWQYRLYFGVHAKHAPEVLYWARAARKPAGKFSKAWSARQTNDIKIALGRVQQWVISHIRRQLP